MPFNTAGSPNVFFFSAKGLADFFSPAAELRPHIPQSALLAFPSKIGGLRPPLWPTAAPAAAWPTWN